MNNIFKFKYFEINQKNAAHKVGTDAMLLGSFLNANSDVKNALEIGTGTGIIALMLAQKTNICIDAIEVSATHAEIAKHNFEQSDYAQKLNAIHISLQEFCLQKTQTYDLIFSNPPYFEEKNNYINDDRKNSRQNDVLSLEDLFKNTEKLMNAEAEFWLILPYNIFDKTKKIALDFNLFCVKQIKISSYENSKIIRGIFVFSKIPKARQTDNFFIYEKEKIYSKEYIRLTKEYHFPALQQENE